MSRGRSEERRGGFKAGSRPIPLRFEDVRGRGPVVGDEPPQRTRRFELIELCVESILMDHFSDCFINQYSSL